MQNEGRGCKSIPVGANQGVWVQTPLSVENQAFLLWVKQIGIYKYLLASLILNLSILSLEVSIKLFTQ